MELNELVACLSWNTSKECQQNAIMALCGMENLDVSILLQPCDKSCWENAALVLKNINYPRIEPIIPGLIRWLQDMNWPGSSIILELLASIEGSTLIRYIEESLNEAKNEEDYIWISGIKELVEKAGLKKNTLMNSELKQILKLAE